MTGETTGPSDGRGGVIDPYEDEEVLDVMKAREDVAEPMTARQIANVNGRSRRATLEKCKSLAEDGVLRSKLIGARARAFWIPLHAGLFEGDTYDY